MADKSNQLVLHALSRAAAESSGVPVHGSKAAPGLFPATAQGRQAAQRCRDEGFLRVLDPATDAPIPGPTTARGKASPQVASVTEKGLAYLLHHVSPRQVLEDLVRALEARQGQVADLLQVVRNLQTGIEGLRGTAEKVLHQLRTSPSPLDLGAAHCNGTAVNGVAQGGSAPDALLAHLERWHAAGASEDCPLPELFRQVQACVPTLTLGRFHDHLRHLQQAGQVYLHPWTGPLYDIPEPRFALLVGHEVAYYASRKMQG